jgi:hypothetical protein
MILKHGLYDIFFFGKGIEDEYLDHSVGKIKIP